MESGCKSPAIDSGFWCRFHEDKNNVSLRMEPPQKAVAAVMPWECNGYVYAVQARTMEGPIKIGFSINVQSRLATLTIGSPVELDLLGFIAGSQQLERQLHGLLSSHRLRGEWFKPQHLVREVVNHIVTGDVFALARWIEAQKALPPTVKPVNLPKIGFPSRFKWHPACGKPENTDEQILY